VLVAAVLDRAARGVPRFRDAVAPASWPLHLALIEGAHLLVRQRPASPSGPAIGLPVGLAAWSPPIFDPSTRRGLRKTFGPAAIKDLASSQESALRQRVDAQHLIRAVAWAPCHPNLIAEAVRLADHLRDLPHRCAAEVLEIASDANPELPTKNK